jgi:hypothetical protein
VEPNIKGNGRWVPIVELERIRFSTTEPICNLKKKKGISSYIERFSSCLEWAMLMMIWSMDLCSGQMDGAIQVNGERTKCMVMVFTPIRMVIVGLANSSMEVDLD